MTLKHRVFNLYRQYVWLLSRVGRSVKTDSTNMANDLYLITIAFNHVGLIERQIKLVKKYVKDVSFKHVIVDNSPDKGVRRDIQRTCERENVEYIGVPMYINKLMSCKLFGYGLSHGAALNWTFYHFLKQRNPQYLVLLDHDVFPLKEYSFYEKLGKRVFYGVERNMGAGWYLWPGWSVFRFEVMRGKKLDFLPIFMGDTYLDAGGGNYKQLYCHYNINDIIFPVVKTKRVRKTKGLNTYVDIYHGDCIQYIDDSWMHIINGSNYAKISGKDNYVNQILEGLA